MTISKDYRLPPLKTTPLRNLTQPGKLSKAERLAIQPRSKRRAKSVRMRPRDPVYEALESGEGKPFVKTPAEVDRIRLEEQAARRKERRLKRSRGT